MQRHFEDPVRNKDGSDRQEPTPVYTFLKDGENTRVPVEENEVESEKTSSNEVETKSKGMLPILLI